MTTLAPSRASHASSNNFLSHSRGGVNVQASQILNPKYVAQSRSTSARASITPAPHSQAGPKRSFAEASAAGTHNVPGYVDPFMAKMWNDDTMKRFLDEVPEQEWKTLRDFDENFRVAEENAMRFGKPSGTTKTYTPASEQEVSKAARGVHTYREIHSTLEKALGRKIRMFEPGSSARYDLFQGAESLDFNCERATARHPLLPHNQLNNGFSKAEFLARNGIASTFQTADMLDPTTQVVGAAQIYAAAKSALASRKAADIYLAGPLGRQEAQCDGTRIAASAMGSDVPEAIVVEGMQERGHVGSGVCAPGDRFKNYNIIGSEACSDESELRDKVFGEEPEDADELARIERYERVQATMKDIFLLDAYSKAKEHASATGTEIEMPTVSISEHGSCESIAAMIRQAHNLGDADPMGHMLRPRNCQSIVRDEKVKLHANGDTTVMTGNLFDAKTVAPPDIEYLVKKHWGELPDPSKPGTELSGMAHTVSNVRALKAIPTPGRYGGMALVDVTEQEKAQRMIRDLGRSIREQWCKGSIDDRKRMQQMLSASQQTATTDIGTDALSVRDTGSFITMLLSVADQLPGSEAASTAGADGTQSSWSQDTAATRRA